MKVSQNKACQQLGDTVRSKRIELGFSQESFASECGVHRTYMGAIERGERNISLINIIKISTALGMKPSELFLLSGL